MNIVVWAILGFLIGPIMRSAVSFGWKKFTDTKTVFDKLYFISMLASMLLALLAAPLLVFGGLLPTSGKAFVFFACAGIAYAANSMIKAPISYVLHKFTALEAAAAKDAVVKAASSAATSTRRLIELAVIVVLVASVAGASVWAAVSYSASVSSSGTLVGVGITFYSDPQGTVSVGSINWGQFAPGTVASSSIYVKSTSNVPVALSFAAANWVPVAYGEQMTLSWNLDSRTVVQPGQIVKVDFSLAASQYALPGSFSVTIVVSAMSQ